MDEKKCKHGYGWYAEQQLLGYYNKEIDFGFKIRGAKTHKIKVICSVPNCEATRNIYLKIRFDKFGKIKASQTSINTEKEKVNLIDLIITRLKRRIEKGFYVEREGKILMIIDEVLYAFYLFFGIIGIILLYVIGIGFSILAPLKWEIEKKITRFMSSEKK